MRFLAFLIVTGVILSVARALTLVLIFTLCISLVWAILTKPGELLGLLLISLIFKALQLRPFTTILFVGLTILVALRGRSDAAGEVQAARNSGKLDN